MGNSKGYVPSEESKVKVSESLKDAYASGRRQMSEAQRQAIREANKRRAGCTVSEEQKRKTSETLKQGYAEGRIQLVGAALAQSQSPYAAKTEEERKARRAETNRVWRAKHPEHLAELAVKYNAKYYGLEIEQYEAEIERRGGLCDICKQPQEDKRLAVDHDHNCCPERRACDKCRRGMLCENCNNMLGRAHDSIEVLESAILYLRSFKQV